MPDIESQPTAVYRLYARDGRLLYVGMTNNPDVRFANHELTKGWWKQVEEKVIEWHPDRATARLHEAAAIKGEAPAFNAMHVAAGPHDVPLRDARNKLSALVDEVCFRREPKWITYFGRPMAVLVDSEFYEQAVRDARFLDALREVAPDVMAALEAGA